jgi:predicted regulator of Ras-like GTPase activity (Roadblock/LC7/MglB family)
VFLERLSSISGRIEGAVALSLVDRDGIPVESVALAPDLDLETVAAEMINQVRAISAQKQELSVGEVRQVTVAGDRTCFVVSTVGDGYYLLLLLKPEASLGRARFELKRATLLFEDDLL